MGRWVDGMLFRVGFLKRAPYRRNFKGGALRAKKTASRIFDFSEYP